MKTQLTIQLTCDTRAFGRNHKQRDIEITRILKSIVTDIYDGGIDLSQGHMKLRDHLGNVVGMATFQRVGYLDHAEYERGYNDGLHSTDGEA